MIWVSVREWVPGPRISFRPAAGELAAEPRGRQVLRVGFGVLWILDGLLQAQPAMPLGLATNVTQPAADGSPGWVRGLVDFAAGGWTYHPVSAAAAAVWIQVGIGIWLLTAARGSWSRLGGLASVGWGLAVWIFGEAFGGILAPGLSWLFGAPGAALLYAVAGTLIALPDRAWTGRRPGRGVLAGTGVFLAGMALLQAWPGRGSWSGTAGGQPGNLASMVQGMAQTSQPGFLLSWVNGFGAFAAAHGFAVNLIVVVALAAAGHALGSGQRAVLRPAVGLLLVLSAADWVLVQDLGVFGGLGTDPNSMIPFALVAVGGYLAVVLVAGRGDAAHLLGAWSNRDGTSWTLSQPYQLGPARPWSASFGGSSSGSVSSGSGSLGVVLSGGRAVWVSGPGAAWRTLPGLPAKASSAPDGGATLAAAPGGGFEALSARGGQLSVWSLSSGGSGWSRSQVINATIPYGSSG